METQTELDSVKESKKDNPTDPSIQCLFSRKPCKRKRLKGFDFCHKHILEDKNSPFQQCSFIIKSTEERCTNPAPKSVHKKTFCLIHTRDPKLKKAHDEIMRRNHKRKLANRKAAMGQKKGSADASTSTSRSPNDPKRPRDEETGPSIDSEMDGIYRLQDNSCKRTELAWFDENESDAESVDSEEEDPLRHAGIWTVEEALKICRDKMIRKRSLYLEQYKRLNLLLRERKRKHLLRMSGMYQNDMSEIGDELNEDGLSTAETRALGLYQHINGTEALLEKQAREKRSRGLGTKMTQVNRCVHSTETERCQNRVLPYTKFCLKHICFDTEQKLFKKCTFQAADMSLCCETPVLQAYRGTTCDLHASLLPRFPSEGLDSVIHRGSSQNTDISSQAVKTSTNDDAEKCDGGKLGGKIVEGVPSAKAEEKKHGVTNESTSISKEIQDLDKEKKVDNTGAEASSGDVKEPVSKGDGPAKVDNTDSDDIIDTETGKFDDKKGEKCVEMSDADSKADANVADDNKGNSDGAINRFPDKDMKDMNIDRDAKISSSEQRNTGFGDNASQRNDDKNCSQRATRVNDMSSNSQSENANSGGFERKQIKNNPTSFDGSSLDSEAGNTGATERMTSQAPDQRQGSGSSEDSSKVYMKKDVS